jgi:hypothetical protein
MAQGRRYLGKLGLVLLVACGMLSSQAAWAAPAHNHPGTPEHCCARCHAGHLPLLEAVKAIQLLAPARADWFHLSDERQVLHDGLTVHELSRAPPSLAVL